MAVIGKIMQSPTIGILSEALYASNLRHNVISNNIANVNTPGFKKSGVAFENILSDMLSPVEQKLSLVRTKDKHLPLPGTANSGLSPQIYEINTTTMRTDGNNVDIDSEMAELAKNNIYYNANVRQLGEYLSSLKSVISGQK